MMQSCSSSLGLRRHVDVQHSCVWFLFFRSWRVESVSKVKFCLAEKYETRVHLLGGVLPQSPSRNPKSQNPFASLSLCAPSPIRPSPSFPVSLPVPHPPSPPFHPSVCSSVRLSLSPCARGDSPSDPSVICRLFCCLVVVYRLALFVALVHVPGVCIVRCLLPMLLLFYSVRPSLV